MGIVAYALVAVLAADVYVPPPAEDIPNYYPRAIPVADLDGKTLRELAILRNTIYARYGWDGFRKQWLHDYFHAQKWFKPNPSFHYKLVSDIDRDNAHLIAMTEASFGEGSLRYLEDSIYARHGKIWNDKTEWVWKSGKKTRSCDKPAGFDNDRDEDEEEPGSISRDCQFAREKWYKPNPKFSEADLTAEDRIELGLIGRQLGGFAVDDAARTRAEQSLDQLLELPALRKLSLRDLRLLRNTIYARRGRPFKSQVIREHFKNMRWYKENVAYSDKLLTDTDRRNVRLIRSVEEELGGALRDEDWLIEPAMDGA